MIGNKRNNRQNDECQNTDHGADVVILEVNGQLVQPCNKQVGLTGGIADLSRSAAREQVDDIEVIDIADK